MVDIRLQRMATVLVNYSLALKPKDRLGIIASPAAADLVREVYRAAIHAGAYVETAIQIPGLKE